MTFPDHRPRRLRRTPALRRLVAETRLNAAELILPVFVREGIEEPVPIASMPGVLQHTESSLLDAVEAARDLGLGGIMLFGIPAVRDSRGSAGLDAEGILNRSVRAAKSVAGEALPVMSDLCLDEFTDHGHCGVLDVDGEVDNDATLEIYAEMAVAQAAAGADVVAPSGMMDGQVAVIRQALDEAGYQDTIVLAYSAKYSSAFYGPFREAVDSQLRGDRRTYQMDAANSTEALRETEEDLAQGADMVMVKPASAYLDILAAVAEASDVPVAAYQVSGEYAMIEAAAAQGWIDRRGAVLESLIAIRRAGANAVLTYYAADVARWLAEESASTAERAQRENRRNAHTTIGTTTQPAALRRRQEDAT